MLNRRSMCWKVILLLICLYLPALGNFCFWLLWCFSPLFLTIFFLLDSFQNFPGKWNAKACSFVNSFWPFKQPLLLWYIYLLAIYIFFSPFVCGLFPSQIPLFAAAFFLPFSFFLFFFYLVGTISARKAIGVCPFDIWREVALEMWMDCVVSKKTNYIITCLWTGLSLLINGSPLFWTWSDLK